jgi:uncharacterized membrane protein YfcA
MCTSPCHPVVGARRLSQEPIESVKDVRSTDSLKRRTPVLGIGVAAGLASGLLGIGGSAVIVPAMVLILSFTQHGAHATSLAAIIPIALTGGVAYAIGDSVDLTLALLLGAGSLVGAPLGTLLMARASEAQLKIAYGAFMISAAATLVLS